MLLHIGLSNDFLDMKPKSMATKAKIKLGKHQAKSFISKRNNQQIKRHPAEQEKIFANHISDRG